MARLETQAVAPIGGIDLNLAKRHLNDVQRAIASINYSDVWKHIGVVMKCGEAAIDAEKPARGKGVNLRLKLKDPSGCGAIVANITIDEDLRKYAKGNDKQMRQRIAQVIRAAIQRSLNTGLQLKIQDVEKS